MARRLAPFGVALAVLAAPCVAAGQVVQKPEAKFDAGYVPNCPAIARSWPNSITEDLIVDGLVCARGTQYFPADVARTYIRACSADLNAWITSYTTNWGNTVLGNIVDYDADDSIRSTFQKLQTMSRAEVDQYVQQRLRYKGATQNCFARYRIQQLESRTTPRAAPSASSGDRTAAVQPTPPPPPVAVSPLLDPGPASRAALADALAQRPRGGDAQPPLSAAWMNATSTSIAAYAKDLEARGKTRVLHNNANDATQCLKVERTLERQEWGINGRYRLINTCGFPVVASWCANAGECDGGYGNQWTLRAGMDYPIFFADPANPFIRVGACRTEQDSAPLPSDAAIQRAGGFNERHNAPIATPGVDIMRGHTCR